MKRIYDLEETEILALSSEQVTDYVDYECALEGVPMLPPAPGPEPKRSAQEPDVKSYEIAGFFTLDADHAGRILAALNSGPLYKEESASFDYKVKHLVPIGDDSYYTPKIEGKTTFSAEKWDAIKNEQAQMGMVIKQWKTANDEYKECLTARKYITEKVWEHVDGVRTFVCEKETIRKNFVLYLKLAEGDRQIAINFLEKVKSLDEYPGLKDELLAVPPAE